MEEKDDDSASLLGSRRYSSLEEKEENYDPRRPHIEAEAKETSSVATDIPEFFLRRSGSIFARSMIHHNTTSRAEFNEYGTTPQERMNKLRQTAYDYYIEKGIPEDKLDEFLVAFIYTYISLTHLDETTTGEMVAQYFGRFRPDADIGKFKRPSDTEEVEPEEVKPEEVKPEDKRSDVFTNFLNTVEAYALDMAGSSLVQKFQQIHGGKNKKSKTNKKAKKNKSKSKRRKIKKTRKTKTRKTKTMKNKSKRS